MGCPPYLHIWPFPYASMWAPKMQLIIAIASSLALGTSHCFSPFKLICRGQCRDWNLGRSLGHEAYGRQRELDRTFGPGGETVILQASRPARFALAGSLADGKLS